MNRTDFMERVYDLLSDYPDNNRANEIIEAADEYADEYAESVKAMPTVQPKNGTLIIPLNESDFKSVKRIMLDNKPWCRTFYEDAPGEASWIREEQPDGGETYTCSHCGVTWQFNDGGPEENEAFFCPKCGFEMVAKEGEPNEHI